MQKKREDQINLIIDRELIKNIDELAQENDMSRSAFVRRLIRQEWQRRQKEAAGSAQEKSCQ